MTKDIRVRNDRLKTVQEAPPGDRAKDGFMAALGSQIYEARDEQTRAEGDVVMQDRNVAYAGDRFGTAGILAESEAYNEPEKLETTRKTQGIKGAETGEYRSGPIGGADGFVVQ